MLDGATLPGIDRTPTVRRTVDRAHLDANREHYKEMRAVIAAARGKPCAVCGVQLPQRDMHLHHRDPSTKRFTVGRGQPLAHAVVLAEIAKCDVLCKYCHDWTHRNSERVARGESPLPRPVRVTPSEVDSLTRECEALERKRDALQKEIAVLTTRRTWLAESLPTLAAADPNAGEP